MKTLVGAFNQEKALVGALSVIVKSLQTFVWSSSCKLHRLLSLSHGFRGNLARFYLLVRGKKSRKWPNLYRRSTFMFHSLTEAEALLIFGESYHYICLIFRRLHNIWRGDVLAGSAGGGGWGKMKDGNMGASSRIIFISDIRLTNILLCK